MDKEPPYQVIVEGKPKFYQRFWMRDAADMAVSIHKASGYVAIVVGPDEDHFGDGLYTDE